MECWAEGTLAYSTNAHTTLAYPTANRERIHDELSFIVSGALGDVGL
jgi:hypothetical protein